MIFWIASYPKSGNTLLRSIIASLFFSDNIIVKLLYGFFIPLALPFALALNLFKTIDFPT